MDQKIQKLLPLGAILMVIAAIVGTAVGTSIGTPILGGVWFCVIFVAVVALAVYRPVWVFWLFIAAMPIEIAIVGSVVGMDIRLYQILAVAAAIGAMVRWKKYCKSFCFVWADWVVVGLVAASAVSMLASPNIALSMRQTLIFTSFVFMYFLVRMFVRSWEDAKDSIPYIFGSYFIMAFYAIWQNWRFARGLKSFEVMAGRPNGAFAEADWLGIYLAAGVVALALFAFLYVRMRKEEKKKMKRHQRGEKMLVHEILLFGLIALILTVTRSAWLAAFVGLAVSAILLWRSFSFRGAFSWTRRVALFIIAALAVVYIFGLTTFELWNRVQSTGSGLQEITIACDTYEVVDFIDTDEDLSQHGCKHINLEDVEKYKADGYFIHKVYRKDPNVDVRQSVWTRSLKEIRAHPLLGIGWGSIGDELGMDERGALLSSSNIFLEFWLGAGIVGAVGIVALFALVAIGAARMILAKKNALTGITLLGVLAAIVVSNLFNSGQFLAFLWVYLGLAVSIIGIRDKT